MRNLVVIEDSTLLSLSQDPVALQTVPCLKTFLTSVTSTAKKRKCNKCGGSTDPSAYNTAKMCIRGLTGSARIALFDLLDARQIRITVTRGGGRSTITIRR